MKRILPLLLIVILASSCKSKQVYANKKTPTHRVKVNTNKKASKKANSIVKYAKTFNGTRYKYGGTTKRGMDCSGLIYTSFNKYNISVPRTTSGLKVAGNWIDLKNVNVGDLLFFATKKNSRKVNHVGIVSYIGNNDVEFIHASSSKGVMVSSISQQYWYLAFVQARRLL